MKEVTLETDRLLLRFPRESDFEEYAKICADPEVMRFLGGQPMTVLEAWRHMAFVIGHWYFRGYGQWVVEEKASGRLVGRIGFTNPADPNADYGRCDGDRTHLANGTVGYTTPRVSGALGALASDWRVSGIVNVRSGTRAPGLCAAKVK